MVAPLAASLSDRVAFVIQVSGWQGPAWRQDAVRVGAELRAAGFPEGDVREATDFAGLRMKLIRGAGPYDELERAQARVKDRAWFASVRWCDRALFESARRLVEYDTEASWGKVRCPVLVVYGGKDTSSGPPGPLVAVIRRGLGKAGNGDVTVRVFPDAGHALCRAAAGKRPRRAGRAGAGGSAAEPDFVAGYLDLMTDWLGKRFPPGP
jgi:pimeloyl-ACP methyl ester carboxylesterase